MLLILALGVFCVSSAQQIALKKGIITDTIKVGDSLAESFALYLPTQFEPSKSWPIVFVFDMQGRGQQVLSMFRDAAEEQQYILAASNNVNDTLTLSKNMLISNRMFNTVYGMLSINKNRSYTAGFASGARFASLVPTFIKNIEGVISCGAPINNTDVLNKRIPFYFIGIIGDTDFNYPDMKNLRPILNKLKFPNQLLVFEGGHNWPSTDYISRAMEIFTLAGMAKGNFPKDSLFVNRTYRENLAEVGVLFSQNKPLLAENALSGMIATYRPHRSIDSLAQSRKTLKKSKVYRLQSRNENAVLFKERLIRDDYGYYLEEDIITYNFNNLGWWKYKMEDLEKYDKSTIVFEQQMGKRLRAYLNALVADNVDALKTEAVLDLEALNFLYMLNTITTPENPSSYLKVIANSAKMEDYGTALFYLEELLKTGYEDRASLYEIEHTALLRITPEFNEVVEKYLKKSRYDLIEE